MNLNQNSIDIYKSVPIENINKQNLRISQDENLNQKDVLKSSYNNNVNQQRESQDQIIKSGENVIKELGNIINDGNNLNEKPNVISHPDSENDQKNLGDEKNLIKDPNFINKLNQMPVVENLIRKQFKNIFRGNDFLENNYYRKRVLYVTFLCILVDLIHLQILW